MAAARSGAGPTPGLARSSTAARNCAVRVPPPPACLGPGATWTRDVLSPFRGKPGENGFHVAAALSDDAAVLAEIAHDAEDNSAKR